MSLKLIRHILARAGLYAWLRGRQLSFGVSASDGTNITVLLPKYWLPAANVSNEKRRRPDKLSKTAAAEPMYTTDVSLTENSKACTGGIRQMRVYKRICFRFRCDVIWRLTVRGDERTDAGRGCVAAAACRLGDNFDCLLSSRRCATLLSYQSP